MTKVYIAGPVSGIPREEAAEKFREAALLLKQKGYEVINPMEVIGDQCASRLEAMSRLLPLLLKCDAVYLLEGWEGSSGALVEMMIARYVEMEILLNIN
jgi:hypothetical protein